MEIDELIKKLMDLEEASRWALNKKTLAMTVNLAIEQGMNDKKFAKVMDYIYKYFLENKFTRAEALAVIYGLLLFIFVDTLKEGKGTIV
jgi:hypothetical protein